MATFYPIAGGLLSLAAILLTGLVLRNRLAPDWLRSEAVATAAGLALTIGVCLAISHAITGLTAAALPYWAVGFLVAAIPAASTVCLWRVFHVADCLARADSGHSPFRRAQPTAASAREQAAIPVQVRL